MINDGYLSLIRQNQRYAYKYEYGVDLTYDGRGVDLSRLAESFGAHGERVSEPASGEPPLPARSRRVRSTGARP